MVDPYQTPGVLPGPGEEPPATAFCLLPELPGVGRSRRRVAVRYTAAGTADGARPAGGPRGTAR